MGFSISVDVGKSISERVLIKRGAGVAFEAAAVDQRILHVLQSSCRWEDAPAIHETPKTLDNRTVRRAAKAVWREVSETLAAAGGSPAEVLIAKHPVAAAPALELGITRQHYEVVGTSRRSRTMAPFDSAHSNSYP